MLVRDDIWNSLFRSKRTDIDQVGQDLTGPSAHGGVSDLAIESIMAAVTSAQRFCRDVFGQTVQVTVDRSLVDLWCNNSFAPDGWRLPPKWDVFSRDYPTSDGWVRLHCNAPHHRQNALAVLGRADTREQIAALALGWRADDLAEAIVDGGGCASRLLTASEWRSHPQGKAIAREPVVAWDICDNAACHWSPGAPERPLRGLKVLDLTRIIAGPVSTRFLSSLGAEVLRIDPPGWVEGANEIELTVGKTCGELDLHKEPHRAAFKDLVRSANVLVHGYRLDALERLGFGVDTLAELNPALISVGLTAYGWTGPWRERRGFDSLVQRSTGLAIERDEKIVSLPYTQQDISWLPRSSKRCDFK